MTFKPTTQTSRQRGFALIEALLIVVIVVICAGTAFYVYDTHKKADTTYKSTAKDTSAAAPAQTPTDFTTYTNKQLGFSFSYPKSWGDVKTPPVTKDVVVNANDSYWSSGFTKDSGDSLLLAGASAHYSNPHAVDDVAYISGYDIATSKKVEPKCIQKYSDSDVCKVLSNNALLASYDTKFGTNHINDWYAVFNLKSNPDNLAAVRLEYIDYKDVPGHADATITVSQADFQQVAQSFKQL